MALDLADLEEDPSVVDPWEVSARLTAYPPEPLEAVGAPSAAVPLDLSFMAADPSEALEVVVACPLATCLLTGGNGPGKSCAPGLDAENIIYYLVWPSENKT